MAITKLLFLATLKPLVWDQSPYTSWIVKGRAWYLYENYGQPTVPTKEEAAKQSSEQLRNKQIEKCKEYLNTVGRIISAGIARFMLVGLMENTLFLHCQISVLAISYTLSGELDYQTVFSIFISLIIALFRFRDSVETLAEGHGCITKLYDDLDEHLPEKAKYLRLWIRLKWWFLALCVCFYAWVLVLAIAEYIAIFRCPYSLWNSNGCADLTKELTVDQTCFTQSNATMLADVLTL